MTPRNTQKRCARRAFTLIELLVVIAIIAILAAILFPVFAQAKAAAKKTADLSNMKQIGLGIVQYSADVDDAYPRGSYFRPDYAKSILFTWREGIFPYVKSGGTKPAYNNGQLRAVGEIFRGPGEPSNSIQGYGGHDGLMPAFQGSASTGDETSVIPSRSQTEVQNVAGVTIVTSVGLASSYGTTGGNIISDYWPWGGSQYPPIFDGPSSGVKYDGDTTDVYPFYKMPRFRYTESTNAAFTDGHAKSIKRGAYNWCKYVYTKGWRWDGGASDDGFFAAGQPCAAYAN